MKKFRLASDEVHDMTNKAVVNTITSVEGVEFVVKLDKLMQERGLSQRELGMITGLRAGTVNSILNGKGTTLNKVQLAALMIGLRITDLTDLIEIRFPDNIKEEFSQESESWVENKRRPQSVNQLMLDNVLLATDKSQKEDK